MTIQGYVDESGLDGRSQWLVFSALLATVEDWMAFSSRWKSILDEHPRLAYFKMNEAVGFTGEFYRWSEANRNQKLIRLAGTFRVGKYGFIENTVTADLRAIERDLLPISQKPVSEPYFWPFQLTIKSACLSILATSPDYDIPMEFFFDEHVIFGPRAKAWYPVVRAMAEPNLRALMPVEPLFRDDKSTMPLQAADLTAWMSRHDRTGANEFAWLKDHLVGLTRSQCSVDFGSKEIALMFDEGPIPAEAEWKVQAARQAFDETFIKGGAKHYVPKPKKQKEKP